MRIATMSNPEPRYHFYARKEVPLSLGVLHEQLDYDPATGDFTRRLGTVKGQLAGSVNRNTGYHYINIQGIRYAGQHLAWMYAFGEWPAGSIIEHIDGNKTNNRLANLYDRTRGIYAASMARIGVLRRSVPKSERSIVRNPKGGFRAWTASYGGIPLGTYETRAEAIAAYEEVAGHLKLRSRAA